MQEPPTDALVTQPVHNRYAEFGDVGAHVTTRVIVIGPEAVPSCANGAIVGTFRDHGTVSFTPPAVQELRKPGTREPLIDGWPRCTGPPESRLEQHLAQEGQVPDCSLPHSNPESRYQPGPLSKPPKLLPR